MSKPYLRAGDEYNRNGDRYVLCRIGITDYQQYFCPANEKVATVITQREVLPFVICRNSRSPVSMISFSPFPHILQQFKLNQVLSRAHLSYPLARGILTISSAQHMYLQAFDIPLKIASSSISSDGNIYSTGAQYLHLRLTPFNNQGHNHS